MRAIVIGTDGLIGGALAEALRARGDSVVGTTRRDKGAGPNELFLDLADPLESGAALPEAEVCFLCAAMTNFADCRARPDLARITDALVPAKITARLAGAGVRTILLSTSAVLDCKEPGMSAERPRAPASLYGQFKAEAEEAVLKHGEFGTVVRLTKVLTPDMRLMGDWIATLRAGREIAAIRDLTIAPLTMRHVVGALIAIADAGPAVFGRSRARATSPMMELRFISRSSLAFPPRLCGRSRRPSGGFRQRMLPPIPLSTVAACARRPVLYPLSQKQ